MSESEEEILVFMEFNETTLVNKHDNIKVIGLETNNPYVQHHKQVYKGEWVDCLGTKLLFSESKPSEDHDPVFSSQIKQQYDCVANTSKILKLQPFILTPKQGNNASSSEDSVGSADSETEIKSESETMDASQDA